MSILIKGMEMPKNCSECAFIHSSWGLDYYCAVAKEYEESDFIHSQRMSSCPLIELPPHGRLIDGDKFYKVMCSHWVLSLGEAYKRLEEFLKKPVIEAERSET